MSEHRLITVPCQHCGKPFKRVDRSGTKDFRGATFKNCSRLPCKKDRAKKQYQQANDLVKGIKAGLFVSRKRREAISEVNLEPPIFVEVIQFQDLREALRDALSEVLCAAEIDAMARPERIFARQKPMRKEWHSNRIHGMGGFTPTRLNQRVK